jgi:hypothetical protein
MRYLLPHRYKRPGAIAAPLGFILWSLMQLGYVNRILTLALGDPGPSNDYHIVEVVIAIGGFFAFLGGLYCFTFSKEKVEDEMVQRTRVDSFQFAAFLQIIVTIAGFLLMLFAGDPGEGGMMLFFVGLVFLFWIAFIARFNYILHVKYRQ